MSTSRFRSAAARSAIGLRERLEQVRVAVLGGVLHELDVADLDLERLLADVLELVPEAVEPLPLGLVEHQPGEVVVLAMIEGERDDLVDGDDLAVAEGGGEDAAELVE